MAERREGMVLDRALTSELFEVALRIAESDSPWAQQRRLLTVALRDYVSAQEAEGKTKKCLTRVWVNPPGNARAMIKWAREHPSVASDRRLLHIGALIATYPFAGSVIADIGRSLSLTGQADTLDIRRRARMRWGDRESVAVGARKVYTTLRNLGVLEGGTKTPLVRASGVAASPTATAWLLHAVLASRTQTSMSEADAIAAPELFWADMRRPNGDYPLLERHTEGLNRTVWEVRRS